MENIFKINAVQNEPQNLAVYVNYNIEGADVETWIRYEDVAAFIAECYPKKVYKALSGLLKQEVTFEPEDVANLDDESLITHIHEFLFKNLHVELRIENRKLKDENSSLQSRLNMAMVQLNVIDVHIDYFTAIGRNIRNLPKTPNIANNGIITVLKEQLEDACHRAVQCFNEEKQWIKEKVLLMKDLPNDIRKSA